MKRTLITVMTLAFVLVASPARAAISFGVRPAFPREDNERTSSIFVHTAEPGAVIREGVRVINSATEEKHLLLYARDSAPSTGGGFACGQLSETPVGVGSWISFDLSTFALIDDATSPEGTTEGEGEPVVESSEVPLPVGPVAPVYIDGVRPGMIPGSVDVVIPPGKDLLVPFTITVPADAQVGESNGCVLVQEVKEDGVDSGVAISMRSGLRVAMTVPGDIRRELAFSSFLLRRENGKVYFMPSIKNTGNVSVDTDVAVIVKSLFGASVDQFGGQFPILRGETYEFNFEMNPTFWGGLYRARAQFAYDATASAQVGVNTGNALTTVYSDPRWFFLVPSVPALFIEGGILLLILVLLGLLLAGVRRTRLRSRAVLYTVKKKETVSDFAKRIGVAEKTVIRLNKLRSPYVLYKDQDILLPFASASLEKPKRAPSKKAPARKKKAPVKKPTKPRARKPKPVIEDNA